MKYPRSILALLPVIALAACSRGDRASPEADPGADATTTAAAVDEGPSEPGTVEDAGNPPGETPYVIALSSPTPVFSASEWPPKDPTKASEARRGVERLGYLRKGARLAMKAGVIKKSNCPEGWYELATGGFVCGKYATVDPDHKELRTAPHAPYADRPLPYDYGLNITPGTPLYRRIPLKRERKEHERTLAVGKGVKTSDVAKKLAQQGEEVPAYLKESGEKPKLGFADLKGESTLVAERMLRGFYLALDRKVEAHSGVFWRTTMGLLAPKDHILVHQSKTEFEGVVLGKGEPKKLPLAFVIGTRARKFQVDEQRARRFEELARFSIVSLTDKRQVVDDRNYYETTEGFWVRDIDVTIARAPKAAPSDLAPGEKWIDVDITSQTLVALEGDKPVYATIVSTGRHDSDPAKDHTTVTGSFRIREKHVTDTMDDDNSNDGTYRIEDVPWVMYFEKSYALHGAFWHSSFGRERSHGCVNLTPHDAKHVFHWAGPVLPEGWHGVAAKTENPGTRIVVHK